MSGSIEPILATYRDSDAIALADMVRTGQVTPIELVETAAALIARWNPHLNAVVHSMDATARAQAAGIDRSALFAGVPFLLKELSSLCAGAPLTNGSAWMKDVVSPIDDAIVSRLRRAGFLFMGKSNSPENGWSIATEPALYGPTRNPWRDGITPGGSSGGAAAAVAAGIVPIAEASDAAGSIRAPASCCGLVGMKPSRGRMTPNPAAAPWQGTVYSLCVSRTVRDTAAYLDAVAGALPGEPYQAPRPDASWRDLAAIPPGRLRIGFTTTPPDGTPIHPEAAEAVHRTARCLEGMGHAVEEFDLPYDGRRAWHLYCRHAAVHNAAFVAGNETLVGSPPERSGLEPVTWALIERARTMSAVEYANNLEALRGLGREIVTALLPYDVYLTPTLTGLPWQIGWFTMSEPDLDRYNAQWSIACFLFPFNISGQPAMSLPLHQSEDGLPVGVQLVGRLGDEATLLALGTVLESAMPWRDRRPTNSR